MSSVALLFRVLTVFQDGQRGHVPRFSGNTALRADCTSRQQTATGEPTLTETSNIAGVPHTNKNGPARNFPLCYSLVPGEVAAGAREPGGGRKIEKLDFGIAGRYGAPTNEKKQAGSP